MGKSGKCSPFRWLCCGSGSVHPEPSDAAEDDAPEPREEALHAPDENSIDQQGKVPVKQPLVEQIQKHPGLDNSSDEPNDICRYYCPLCMMYFEAVYETLCCGHTICDDCALGYMRSASCSLNSAPDVSTMPVENWIVGETIVLVEGTGEEKCMISPLLPNACTFCREQHPAQRLPADKMAEAGSERGFQLKLVLPGLGDGVLRNYEDTPTQPNKQPPLPGSLNGSVGPSPLRVGDSFEKMKAKMVPFEKPPPGPSGVVRANAPLPSETTPRPAIPAASTNTPLATPLVHPPGLGAVDTPGGDREIVTPGPMIGAEISVQPGIEAQ